jgi:hypothetical protein
MPMKWVKADKEVPRVGVKCFLKIKQPGRTIKATGLYIEKTFLTDSGVRYHTECVQWLKEKKNTKP